jgi:hypothetical protein
VKEIRVALALALALVSTSRAEVLDGIAARIDRGIITWSQVVQEAYVRRLTGEPEGGTSLSAVLDALVERRLLLAEAEKLRLDLGPGEISGAVERLAREWETERFWERVKAVGLTRSDLEKRAREVLLVKKYLDLRREMTFVPEAEIRASYAAELVRGEEPRPEFRDEVRARLAESKFRAELARWIDRQKAEGRVHLIPLREE